MRPRRQRVPNNHDITMIMTAMVKQLLASPVMLQRLSRHTAPETPEPWLATSPHNLQSAPSLLRILLRREAACDDSGGRLDNGHGRRVTRQTLAEAPSRAGQLLNREGGRVLSCARKLPCGPSLTMTTWLTYHQLFVTAAPEHCV